MRGTDVNRYRQTAGKGISDIGRTFCVASRHFNTWILEKEFIVTCDALIYK
jgi:hypothetical protein